MANTLTSLAAEIYNARDMVAREAVGAINSVLVNTGSEVAAFGDTVRSFVTAAPTLNTSYTPAMTIPNSDDQTVSSLTLSLDQVANVKIGLTGEEIKHLDNGAGAERVRIDMFAQAFRKITNTIESYLCTQIAKGSSRATGTAGTTPFASSHNVINELRQILRDNGTPVSDGQLSMILNTSAGTKFRNLSNLFKVNEAGSSELLRKGELTTLSNFSIKESAGIYSHTKGTGSGYLINNGNVAVGSVALTLDTGSGTIVAGDVLTHASDTVNKYIVGTALAANVVTLNNPGLMIATLNNDAVTVGNNYVANLAFHRNAVELVMRAPAQPYGGDAAVDRMTMSDPASGLNFEIAEYKGYGKVMYDITCFYTAKVWKSEFVATLLG